MKRCLAILALATAQLCAVELPTTTRSFLAKHCYDYDFNFTQPTEGRLTRGEFARRLGTTNCRQHLVTPEGNPFLILGLSHVSGAWQGLLGPRKQQARENLQTDLRDMNFNAVGYVPDLGAEFNYIHNADHLPGSPGTVTGQGQRKHLYEDVFDPAFHARSRKHIQGITDKTRRMPIASAIGGPTSPSGIPASRSRSSV